MMNKTVVVKGLTVERGGREVLHGLDFTLPAGQVTGLLGPSGCGKTTLMRTIVGVQQGVRGDVQVLGEAAGSASLRDRIGYVTQAASVYDDLTVTENLRFFARVLGAGSRAAGASVEARSEQARSTEGGRSTEQIVDQALETVGLEGHADQVVGNLSGGQRSRASLAVALLGQPDLLVLDEPTVGLDPVLRRELWETFHQLADSGAAVLVSSHVMDEADRCDRLLLMRDGVIVADDSPAELRRATGAADIESAFLHLIAEEGDR